MRDLSKPMLKARDIKRISGVGKAWFYISPTGLELCVAPREELAGSLQFKLSRKQLEASLQVIREYEASA